MKQKISGKTLKQLQRELKIILKDVDKDVDKDVITWKRYDRIRKQ